MDQQLYLSIYGDFMIANKQENSRSKSHTMTKNHGFPGHNHLIVHAVSSSKILQNNSAIR